MVLIGMIVFFPLAAVLMGFSAWRKIKLTWQRPALAIVMTSTWLVLFMISIPSLFPKASPDDISIIAALPQISLILDRFSQPYMLALLAVLIYLILDWRFSTTQLAWILGLGSATLFSLIAGNVFTLLMGWTLVELILLIFSFLHQKSDQLSTYLSMPFIFRLIGPGFLIFAGLYGRSLSANWSLQNIPPEIALLVAGATLFRWGIWLPSRFYENNQDHNKSFYLVLGCLPSAIGSMLMYRISALNQALTSSVVIGMMIGGLSILIAGWWILNHHFRETWKIFYLGLIVLSYFGVFYQQSNITFGLGLLILMPGLLLFLPEKSSPAGWFRLAVLVIGITPIPFFPAFEIASISTLGIAGLLASATFGLLLVGVSWILLEDGNEIERSFDRESLRLLPGYGIILITQWVVIVPRSTLTQGILSGDWDWRYLFFLIFLIPFLIWLLRWQGSFPKLNIDYRIELFGFLYHLGKLFERMTIFLIGLLEGRGGLLWTLLIAFLILTLINVTSGR